MIKNKAGTIAVYNSKSSLFYLKIENIRLQKSVKFLSHIMQNTYKIGFFFPSDKSNFKEKPYLNK